MEPISAQTDRVTDTHTPSENLQCTTYFSLSPSHLDTRSEEDIEKNVELFASVATALAK